MLRRHVRYTNSGRAVQPAGGLARRAVALRQGDSARLQARAARRGAGAVGEPRAGVRGAGGGGQWVTSTGSSRSSAPSRTSRPVHLRVRDWKDVYLPTPEKEVRDQGARCMDCGIPFCHQGCPLGNHIPDWNDLVYRHRWQAASDRLHATNNFPGLHRPAVPGAVRGLVRPRHQRRSGDDQEHRAVDRRAGVRGGLDPRDAAGDADRQARGGGRIGPGRARGGGSVEQGRAPRHGLREVRSHRRPAALRHPRVQDREAVPQPPARAARGRKACVFRTGVNVGVDVPAATLRARVRRHRAVRRRRRGRATCRCPGASSAGIHFAVDYLTQQNRTLRGRRGARRIR